MVSAPEVRRHGSDAVTAVGVRGATRATAGRLRKSHPCRSVAMLEEYQTKVNQWESSTECKHGDIP